LEVDQLNFQLKVLRKVNLPHYKALLASEVILACPLDLEKRMEESLVQVEVGA
jgi:hypothetical protein